MCGPLWTIYLFPVPFPPSELRMNSCFELNVFLKTIRGLRCRNFCFEYLRSLKKLKSQLYEELIKIWLYAVHSKVPRLILYKIHQLRYLLSNGGTICDVEYRTGPYCQKLYLGLNGHFSTNLTLYRTLTAWIYIQREEFGNLTIFCRILCRLVEIYYWLLQNQCSRNRYSHIYRFILVNFKYGEITINWFEFTVACSILYRSIISIYGCKFMVCIHYE